VSGDETADVLVRHLMTPEPVVLVRDARNCAFTGQRQILHDDWEFY
jgi:hypothetical protein